MRLRSFRAAERKSTRYTELFLDLLPRNPLGILHRFLDRFEVVLLLELLDKLFVEIDGQHNSDLFPGFVEFAASDVTAHVGSCSTLGQFEAGRFDIVFASNLLEHLTRQEITSTLKEMGRVLRPGGRVILVQPNFRYCSTEYFDDYTHVMVFTHVSLTDLLSASGFCVEKVVPRFMPFSMQSCLPQWSWAVALYLRSPIRPMAKQMLIVATVREGH